MITILPLALGLVAGIGLYACTFHFFVGIRQRPYNALHLTFAGLIFLVVGQIIANAIAQTTNSFPMAITSFKFGISLVALALIALLWFVALCTQIKSRWFLFSLTAVSAFLAIFNLTTPYSLTFEKMTGLTPHYFPWGEMFFVIEGTPSPWQVVSILLFLIIFSYTLKWTPMSRQQIDENK